MSDKANNKNSAEKPNEVSLKTPPDFYSSSYLQPQESSQEHSMQGIDSNLLATCFSNILEKFPAKQANMGNFAEVLAENQSKNMSRISTEIGMQLNSFHENLSACKANRGSG